MEPDDAAEEARRLRLHYRAFAIVLCVHYCEFIKGTVQRTLHPNRKRRTGREFPDALDELLAEGLIRPDERAELVKLSRYRNDLAHRIEHALAGAALVSTGRETAELVEWSEEDLMLSRLRHYAETIGEILGHHHEVVFSLAPYLFEGARQEFESELVRIRERLADLDAHIQHAAARQP